MEGCDQAAIDSFKNMMNEVELPVSGPVVDPHPLLNTPNYFITPPGGYEQTGEILLSPGGVISSFNYGQLWAGERKGGAPTREELRSASELAENLAHFIIDEKH
jgi:hypothetical protein